MKTLISKTPKGRAMESLVARLRAEHPGKKPSVTLLVPERVLDAVDRIAKHANQSRTRVIVELLKVGLGEAIADLEEKPARRVRRSEARPC